MRTKFVRTRIRKRSQMEIMGLAIIIILIMLGVLFAIRFVLQKPGSDIRKSYLESQQAANMINVIIGTTTDCHGITIKGLIQDCAVTASIQCGSLSSCQYVDDSLNIIFAETFVSWKRDFRFYMEGTDRIKDMVYGDGCPGEFESETRPIPTRAGIVELILEICG